MNDITIGKRGMQNLKNFHLLLNIIFSEKDKRSILVEVETIEKFAFFTGFLCAGRKTETRLEVLGMKGREKNKKYLTFFFSLFVPPLFSPCKLKKNFYFRKIVFFSTIGYFFL